MDTEPGGSLLYDTPLHNPTDDRLDRAGFAAQLARAITAMDAAEGFVFALQGSWGSGKTTLINFTLQHLKQAQQDETPIVVCRFDPWWFSGSDQLVQQFFSQLGACLGQSDRFKRLEEIGEKIEQFAGLLSIAKWIPVVGKAGGAISTAGKAIASTARKAGKTAAEDLHGLRASIDDLLRKQDARILVVMDDIDRLSALEIRQVFQLVKASANFPKTIYLLAFDRDVVVRALDSVQGGTGDDYLEKIVQLSLDLPSPDRLSLRRLLFDGLEPLLAGTPDRLWSRERWGNVYVDGIDPFINTPRDVKRFLNLLRATYPIVKGEVNAVDFLAMQALRLFAPQVPPWLVSRKMDLVGTDEWPSSTGRSPESRQEIFESMVRTLAEKGRGPVQRLLTQLFPRFESAFTGPAYHTNFLPSWRREQRVCSPEFFDRYFLLSISPGDIGAMEMTALLAAAEQPAVLGEELIRLAAQRRPDGTTRVRSFLDRLEDLVPEDLPHELVRPILEALLDVGDNLIKDEDDQGMFDHGNDMRLLRLSTRLLARFRSKDERFEVLREAITRARSLYTIVHEISAQGDEHGKYRIREAATPTDQQTVTAEQLAQLEQVVVQKLWQAANEGRLPKAFRLGTLLVYLARWDDEHKVRDYVRQLTSADEGFVDYVIGFLGVSHPWGMGSRVSSRDWQIDSRSVSRFLDLQTAEIVARCENLLTSKPQWLSERGRIALQTLVQAIQRGDAGNAEVADE